jgi:uncharacterized membrane protein YqjE
VSDATEERPAGLGSALRNFGGSAMALLRTRLELASVEFDQERERIKQMLVLTVVATVFLCFALSAASALVVVWFWDTNRIAALVGITIVYAAIGGGALLVLRRVHAGGGPFAATLSELEQDAELLRRKP